MNGTDPMPNAATSTPGAVRAALVWRPTWPVGPADDFVADLPDIGWARLKQVDDHLGHRVWQWIIGGRASPEAGSAEAREMAEDALRRRLRAAAARN